MPKALTLLTLICSLLVLEKSAYTQEECTPSNCSGLFPFNGGFCQSNLPNARVGESYDVTPSLYASKSVRASGGGVNINANLTRFRIVDVLFQDGTPLSDIGLSWSAPTKSFNNISAQGQPFCIRIHGTPTKTKSGKLKVRTINTTDFLGGTTSPCDDARGDRDFCYTTAFNIGGGGTDPITNPSTFLCTRDTLQNTIRSIGNLCNRDTAHLSFTTDSLASEYFWDLGNGVTESTRTTNVHVYKSGEHKIKLIRKNESKLAIRKVEITGSNPNFWKIAGCDDVDCPPALTPLPDFYGRIRLKGNTLAFLPQQNNIETPQWNVFAPISRNDSIELQFYEEDGIGNVINDSQWAGISDQNQGSTFLSISTTGVFSFNTDRGISGTITIGLDTTSSIPDTSRFRFTIYPNTRLVKKPPFINKFDIFPNPIQNGSFEVQLSFTEVMPNFTLYIYDMLGRKIFEQTEKNGLTYRQTFKNILPTRGVYTLKIETRKGVSNRQIVYK